MDTASQNASTGVDQAADLALMDSIDADTLDTASPGAEGGQQQGSGDGQQQEGQQAQDGQQPGQSQQGQPSQQASGILRDLLDERDRRQALERRLAEVEGKNKQAEADPELEAYLQPGKFTDARIQAAIAPIVQQLETALDFQHRQIADGQYSREEVEQLGREAHQLMLDGKLSEAEAARIRTSPARPNVYMNVVEMMRERALLSAVGNDPNAYRERLAAELLADPDFLARAQLAARSLPSGASRPVAQQPRTETGQFAQQPARTSIPSLTRAGSTAAAKSAVPLDLPDEELIAEIDAGR
jgi:hypothetical protein